jgi:hypothetical protein
MTQQHPITPPPELVKQWIKECDQPDNPRWQEYEQDIATRAAQWGADQELEACCEWVTEATPWAAEKLRAARRPKPPSLKQRALKGLDIMIANGHLDAELAAAIREVLEASHD